MALPLSGLPHLFDMILEAAPRESLLPLRGVCRAFKARVDAHMLDHIVVFVSTMSHNDMYIHGPHGERIPCTMEWNLAHPMRKKAPGLIYDRAGDSEEGKPHIVDLQQRLQAVRILDIRGWVSIRTQEVLRTLRPQVSRLIADFEYGRTEGTYELASDNFVIFGAEARKYNLPIHQWFPPNTRRAVVVVDYNLDCQWYADFEDALPTGLKLVVIFKPHYDFERDEIVEPDTLFMTYFGESILSQIPRIEVTLVNAHRVPFQLFGMDPDDIESDVDVENHPAATDNHVRNAGGTHRRRRRHSRSTLEKALRGILTEYAVENRFSNDEAAMVAAVRDNVRLLSRKEYRDEVGKARFTLETVVSERSTDMLFRMPE